MQSSPPASGPLAGVKVVELSHLIAGPYCCQMLADEGATVIKVEPPGGELTRHRQPSRRTAQGEVTAYYASLNRDKQSVVLDLKNPEGAAIMTRLIEEADVFVTNMRASALKRLGLHPQDLHKRYPRLVIASISGFGMENSGESAGRAGLAIVAEAMSGATGLTRDHQGNPVWCGFALGDITAAVSAHAGILLALRNQEKHGIGKVLDVGLVECMLPMVTVAMGRAQVKDETFSGFSGSNSFHGIPYGAFPCSDGAVNIGVNRDDFWRQFCVAMGKPELGTDPRYATYVERARRQQEVHAITEEFTRARTRQQVVDKLVSQDVPVAAILQLEEVISDGYLTQRGALWECDDGIGGKFTLPANTAWFEKPKHTPKIPRLGEHRDAVLKGALGVSPGEIDRLAGLGAFGTPEAEAVTERKSQSTAAGATLD
ncbi:CaiB/BaiF CoA transferase family protein [Variovorax sp. LjRoot178]|uniref:CaiB/BaiF CoA transferase family protein n=1 Tax=Variovorax sp. LjRoot178 TaxID=3342277 RepID=UPI003ECE1B64